MARKFDRTILITGGTAGLGYHSAVNIAQKYPSDQIIIASRSEPHNSSAASINQLLGQNNVSYMRLDLSNLNQIRSFAADWEKNEYPPIAALVLNAGLEFPNGVTYTSDGFESTFAINHIGHALLFSLLYPYLADDARVVVTSSGTHDPAQKTGLPDAKYTTAEELAHPTPETAKNAGRQRYATSKLANVLWTYALHRRFTCVNTEQNKNLTVTAFDPGLMPGTGLAREESSIGRFLWNRVLPKMLPVLRFLLSPNIHRPEESGANLARLAIGDDVKGESGVYYEGKKKIKSSKDSYDEKKQEDLWHWTVTTVARNEEERKKFEIAKL